VVLLAEAPDYPTYAFGIERPQPVFTATDTMVPVRFETVEPGTLSYGNVRIAFEAIGPGDVTFSTGEYSSVNSGYWGDEAGFELTLDYLSITEWTLNFDTVGSYTITFRCFVVEDDGLGGFVEGTTIATESVVIDVEAPPRLRRREPRRQG